MDPSGPSVDPWTQPGSTTHPGRPAVDPPDRERVHTRQRTFPQLTARFPTPGPLAVDLLDPAGSTTGSTRSRSSQAISGPCGPEIAPEEGPYTKETAAIMTDPTP